MQKKGAIAPANLIGQLCDSPVSLVRHEGLEPPTFASELAFFFVP